MTNPTPSPLPAWEKEDLANVVKVLGKVLPSHLVPTDVFRVVQSVNRSALFEEILKALRENHDAYIESTYGEMSFNHNKDKDCDDCDLISRAEESSR